VSNNYRLAINLVATIVAANLCHPLPSNARQPVKTTSFPASGKVLSLTNGDLMCYVDLLDARGKKYNLGANFEICEQSQFVNKQVKLTYKRGKVNDCQSAEPCGKTRVENLVSKIQLIRRK
jgi:hypothetical protein